MPEAAPVYRIKRWVETFENRIEARRPLKAMEWTSNPVDLESTGLRTMLAEGTAGHAALGIWLVLPQVVGSLPREMRDGRLLRRSGTPHTVESLAIQLGVQPSDLHARMTRLVSAGWLEVIETNEDAGNLISPDQNRSKVIPYIDKKHQEHKKHKKHRDLAPASGATADSGAVATEATERTADPLAASELAASPVEAVEPAQPTRAKPRRRKSKSEDEPGEAVERDRPPERGGSEATERPVRSDHKRVIEAYFDAYRERLGRKPAITGREAKVVREMLDGGLSGDEIIAALPSYLDLAGWEAEQGWPLWALPGAWNKLQAGRSGGKPGSSRSVADSIRDTFAKLGGK